MSPNTNFPQNLNITPSAHPLLKLADVFAYDAQRDAINQYGIAGRVWETAYATSLYVNPPPTHEFEPYFLNLSSPRTVIELGSGSGVVAAAIGNALDPQEDLMIATDLPEVCPLLTDNLYASPRRTTLVRPLPWGDVNAGLQLAYELFPGSNRRTLTHIIGSDLVYFPELLAPLLRTLIQLTSPPFVQESLQPVVIISHKIRSFTKENAFWSAFGLWFSFKPILVKTKYDPDLHGQEGNDDWQRFGADMDDNIWVFAAQRRAESLPWEVPDDDRALLDGVNAWGNPEKKSDDTFESLLFMSFQTN